ncbi:MAG: alkaline phosphatase [Bacteroidales bacterium]
MRTRNILLILFVAVATAAMAKNPKNIIIMIGDGMGINQVQAAFTANGGTLNMTDRCPVIGYSKTNSANDYTTDSAAGGTAIAGGKKTNNGMIGVAPDGSLIPSILAVSKKSGLSTGVVSTSSVTHATPASFVAHEQSRSDDENIAADFLDSDIDVFIGGGRKFFETRKDGRNISEELKQKGYQVVYTLEDARNVKPGKMGALVTAEHLAPIKDRDPNFLADASMAAINALKNNKKGFVLMIEGSQIDWGGHANDADYMIGETLDFDRAVGKVLDFAEADGNTLVVITADHETGGLAISKGDYEKKEITVKFTSKGHTASPVPIFAFGPGAEKVAGFRENTSFFNQFTNLLRLKK